MQPVFCFYSRGWPALGGRSCANPHGNPRAPSDHIISYHILRFWVRSAIPRGARGIHGWVVRGGVIWSRVSCMEYFVHIVHIRSTEYTQSGAQVQGSVRSIAAMAIAMYLSTWPAQQFATAQLRPISARFVLHVSGHFSLASAAVLYRTVPYHTILYRTSSCGWGSTAECRGWRSSDG